MNTLSKFERIKQTFEASKYREIIFKSDGLEIKCENVMDVLFNVTVKSKFINVTWFADFTDILPNDFDIERDGIGIVKECILNGLRNQIEQL